MENGESERSQDGSWQVMKIPSSGEHQDSGYGFYSRDKAGTIGFQVRWISPVTLELQKVDGETGQPAPQGKGSLEGAEYTVYAAEDMGELKKRFSGRNHRYQLRGMGKSFRPASGEILCKGNKGSGRIFFR